MTNILYLNDSSEFTHALDLFSLELMKNKNNIPRDELPGVDFIKTFIKYLSSTRNPIGYVFSLSKNGDDISQWRGYCPEGGF
jgi:hypothetical protein